MKIQIATVLACMSLLTSAKSMAAQESFGVPGSKDLKCTNGEEIEVSLAQVSSDTYKAAVKMQSVGDSYPVYHFTKIGLQPIIPGGPAIYKSKDFEMSVAGLSGTIHATLNISSLGIKNTILTCE